MKPITAPLSATQQSLEDKSTPPNQIKGIKSGFKHLDEMTNGFKKGELIVIGSRPAMGKTSLALQIAYNVCTEYKKPVTFFSSESLADELTFSLLTMVSKVDSRTIRKKSFTAEDLKKIISATSELAELPIFINDKYSLSVKEIAALCREKKKQDDLSLVVIDYLQLIKGDEAIHREEQIGKIIFELKAMARELDCPVILLSHLNKSIESRPNRRPLLTDFRESGTIEQIADVVLFLYRDEVYDPKHTPEPGIAEIIVAKDRANGIGTCKLLWKGSIRRFENISED
jgi:replicative DNA helicase